MPLWALRNVLECVDADSIPQLGRIWRLLDEVSRERGSASRRPTGPSLSGDLEEIRFHPVCIMRASSMRYFPSVLAKWALLNAVFGVAGASGAELRINVVGPDGEPAWARLEIRGEGGQMHQPPGALRDRTARSRPGGRAWYLGSFAAQGETVVAVPSGSYTVVAERGPEFLRLEERVTVSEDQPAEARMRLEPWIRMNELGWWSADFHIHRPPEEAQVLLLAEDLNLGVVFTMWNKRDVWEGKGFPSRQEIEVDPDHVITVLNAEDERGGGAWMLHGLRQKLDLAVDGRWFPAGLRFIREAKAQRPRPRGFPWFDSEKPFWWEVPVVMALSAPDSLGVLHNHFNQYGIHNSEAWGRPRDRERYPGPEGFVEASLDLYYRYLNLGFRLPPSAGSASGVLPNPVGYNRIYVRMDQPFNVRNWYEAYRKNSSFVTNGPMLFVDTHEPQDREVQLTIDARSRDPLDRIEIVANGRVVQQFKVPDGRSSFRTEVTMNSGEQTWVAVRCFAKSDTTVRMAHSRPVFFDNGEWDTRSDAQFFVKWIDELIAQTKAEPDRFSSDSERNAVLSIYEQASNFYTDKTH